VFMYIVFIRMKLMNDGTLMIKTIIRGKFQLLRKSI